jgi:NADPH:quinone reductase-like Zn-dependent oxidoreductase
MKVVVRSKYGPPATILGIEEVEIPVPQHNEVLIRVYASTANRTDYHMLTGEPFLIRLLTGLTKPRSTRIGSDFAGQIEKVGESVQSFNVGDAVMGFGGMFGCGSLAQYISLPETRGIIKMPVNMSYEQAAACLEGTFYAASLVNMLHPQAGQKALVYGATGAIGSAYIQFLKFYGLYVTAVCRGEHAALVKSLGADRVIDYSTDDFTKDSEKYEFVFDAVGKSSFLKCKRLLKRKGSYISSDGLENIFWVLFTRLFGGKRVELAAPRDIKGNLNFIKDLIEKGKFKPLIDRTYSLDKIAEAFQYVGTKQKVGNVVIEMNT